MGRIVCDRHPNQVNGIAHVCAHVGRLVAMRAPIVDVVRIQVRLDDRGSEVDDFWGPIPFFFCRACAGRLAGQAIDGRISERRVIEARHGIPEDARCDTCFRDLLVGSSDDLPTAEYVLIE